jgi:hypothetical protein
MIDASLQPQLSSIEVSCRLDLETHSLLTPCWMSLIFSFVVLYPESIAA